MNFNENYFFNLKKIIDKLDIKKLDKVVNNLVKLKKRKGKLIILGVGGSAGNSSHAVNDFRKLCGINAYSPTDNISELTARTNDEGWETIFIEWLKISEINKNDIVLIFSVGGGNKKYNVSTNLIKAIEYCLLKKIFTISLLGKENGYAAKKSNISISIEKNLHDIGLLTPISETMQTVIWHYLVSHPKLKIMKTKW